LKSHLVPFLDTKSKNHLDLHFNLKTNQRKVKKYR
jgi:hypothetical protein